MIPFRAPAKVTFAREALGKLPSMSPSLAVVLDRDSFHASASSPAWLHPYLTNKSISDDLQKGKLVWIYPSASQQIVQRLLLVPAKEKSAGDRASRARALRKAGEAAVRELNSRSISDASMSFSGSFSADEVGKCVNSALIANFKSVKRQLGKSPSEDSDPRSSLNDITLCLREELYNSRIPEINYWAELARGAILARNLVNQPPTLATPAWIHEQAGIIVSNNVEKRMEMSAVVGSELEEKGYGCLYAVGKGAVVPPRLVSLCYKGKKETPGKFTIGFVGKGVTFDTGGLNLKGSGNIEDMHLDKSGACTVLAAMHCIAELGLPINVVGCLALAENAIGRNSYKPSDVLTSLNGKTVEITNTDAEGRLCLADALEHVQRYYKPDILIDVATLTGACMVALGEKTAGLFSNNDGLARSLLELSDQVGEPFWRLPILEEHVRAMKGRVADLKNSGNRWGGACTAAAFLQEFINKDVKWAHLDVAGPAMEESPKSKMSNGTGFSTQLLVHFAKSQAEAK